ncbi:hypothetical protein HYS94_04085 [Candidatus Daviesbacteria bacterium]|nr:hypothetical protein [Candidatus Daviesbacteria bacterium]
MSLDREFERAINFYLGQDYNDVAEFLELQQAAIRIFIDARGAPIPPNQTIFTVQRIHSSEDLEFRLIDLEDPTKTSEIIRSLYINQYGEPNRLIKRSLNAVLRNSLEFWPYEYERSDRSPLTTIDVMGVTSRKLDFSRYFGKSTKEIFINATHPLRTALESAGILPKNSLDPAK